MVNMRSEGTSKEVPEEILLPPVSFMKQDELTSLDILLIVMRRKKLVGVVTAICVGIALLVAFALPEEYTATVVIVPPMGRFLGGSIQASPSTGKSGAVKESSVPRGKNLI